MEKLTSAQKKEVDAFVENADFCNLIIYFNSLNNVRNLETLEQTFQTAKRYFFGKLSKKHRAAVNDIMGTAHMLYTDFEGAANYFIDSGNVDALQRVLEQGLMYGRYGAVKKVCEFGVLQNRDQLKLTRSQFNIFVLERALPHIPLSRDGDQFFVNEDILDAELCDIGRTPEVLKDVVERMYKFGSQDIPRKLLLALYSGDETLVRKARQEFNAKAGKRANIDSIVENICSQNGLRMIGKMQAGDSDDYYPLSAHLYEVEVQGMQGGQESQGAQPIAEADRAKGRRLVLKENIAYQIDYSCVDGYSMELELYESKLKHPGIPEYLGSFTCHGLEFILLEKVSGEQITKYTNGTERLPLAQTIDITMQMADMLKYLHSNGVIYADTKDKNVMYDGKTAKLLDFGMASTRMYKVVETGQEFVYEVVSNAEYACPETIMMSRVYKKSDVFQLGIMFYKLLTGKHPFAVGKATENYTERESELVAFSLANLWNKASFNDPVFVENPLIAELLEKMLDKDYQKRPDEGIVYSRLEVIQDEITRLRQGDAK